MPYASQSLRSPRGFIRAVVIRKPVAKAAATPPPVVAVSDRYEKGVAAHVLRMFELAAASIPLTALAEAIDARRLVQVMEVLDLDARLENAFHGAGLAPNETSLQEALRNVFQEGAYAEMRDMEARGRKVVKAADEMGAAIAFDVLNPEAIEALRNFGGKLIREISEDTRKSVVARITTAFLEGGHPFEQARTIRQLVGLTSTQAAAVGNFRKMLEGDPASMREALTRTLRDKRFDPTVLGVARTGARLSTDQVDKMVGRYYDRYRKYRAEMIARTETMRASHLGQQELWRQGAVQGVYPQDRTRRHWIVQPKACPICLDIPRANPDGVGLDMPFLVPGGGSIMTPPLHPHCKCGVGIRFLRPRR